VGYQAVRWPSSQSASPQSHKQSCSGRGTPSSLPSILPPTNTSYRNSVPNPHVVQAVAISTFPQSRALISRVPTASTQPKASAVPEEKFPETVSAADSGRWADLSPFPSAGMESNSIGSAPAVSRWRRHSSVTWRTERNLAAWRPTNV
jgi:hypothetical protein